MNTDQSIIARCEAVVDQRQAFFADRGIALAKIRDSKSYKANYGTFQNYCQTRHGMSRQRAYQLMAAAKTYVALAECIVSNREPQEEVPRRVRKSSQVYFIQAVSGGLIKIGWANLPSGRLGAIQTMSPVTLRILATVDGDRSIERQLHLRFQSDRSHGEWFHPSPALLQFIESEALVWQQ